MFAEGFYKGKATSWGWSETSNGNPRFYMAFNVIGMLDKADPKATPKPCDPGTGVWSITPTTDKAEDWLVRTVKHLGYAGDGVPGLDPDNENAHNFEDVEFIVKCKHKEYEGQTREEWSVSSPPAKLGTDKMLALQKKFGSKFKDAKNTKVATDMAPVAPKTEADKVPF